MSMVESLKPYIFTFGNYMLQVTTNRIYDLYSNILGLL